MYACALSYSSTPRSIHPVLMEDWTKYAATLFSLVLIVCRSYTTKHMNLPDLPCNSNIRYGSRHTISKPQTSMRTPVISYLYRTYICIFMKTQLLEVIDYYIKWLLAYHTGWITSWFSWKSLHRTYAYTEYSRLTYDGVVYSLVALSFYHTRISFPYIYLLYVKILINSEIY